MVRSLVVVLLGEVVHAVARRLDFYVFRREPLGDARDEPGELPFRYALVRGADVDETAYLRAVLHDPHPGAVARLAQHEAAGSLACHRSCSLRLPKKLWMHDDLALPVDLVAARNVNGEDAAG